MKGAKIRWGEGVRIFPVYSNFDSLLSKQRQQSIHANIGDSIDAIANAHSATVQEDLDEKSPLLKSEERGIYMY